MSLLRGGLNRMRMPSVYQIGAFRGVGRNFCEAVGPKEAVEPPKEKAKSEKESLVNWQHPYIARMKKAAADNKFFSNTYKDLQIVMKKEKADDEFSETLQRLCLKMALVGLLVGTYVGYYRSYDSYSYKSRVDEYTKNMCWGAVLGSVIGFVWPISVPLLAVYVPIRLTAKVLAIDRKKSCK